MLAHILYSGRVQGVGFRYTAHRAAIRNQLTGFVRNLPDGSVEIIAQGQTQDIDDFEQKLGRDMVDHGTIFNCPDH